MRKSFLFLIVLALVAGLFISCNNNISAREDYVYVRFSETQSKELNNQIKENPDLGTECSVESAYWFYTAEKTGTERGDVGSTLSKGVHTPKLINAEGGLEGTFGPFSSGTWKFVLYGYTDADKTSQVYEGVCTLGNVSGSVKLERQASDSAAQVISVALKNVLTTGKVNIKDTTFYDGNNGTMLLTTAVYKEDAAKTSTIFDKATVTVEPIEIKEDSEYASIGAVGTYIYEFNMFEGFLSSDSVAREVVGGEETDTIIWSDVQEGVYRIESYLWYDSDGDNVLDDGEEVQTMYNNYMIVYPREVLTISGGVKETTSLASVQFSADAVARLDHDVDGDVHQYWFGSLQDAVNYGYAGDEIELLNAPGTTSLVVNRPVKLIGPTKLISKIKTFSSISEDLIVYTSYKDEEDDNITVVEFISDIDRIGSLMEEDFEIVWLSGTLPLELARNSEKGNVVVPTMQMIQEMLINIEKLGIGAVGSISLSPSEDSPEMSASGSLELTGGEGTEVVGDAKYSRTGSNEFLDFLYKDAKASLKVNEEGDLELDLSFDYIATEKTETPNKVEEDYKSEIEPVMVTDIEIESVVSVEYSLILSDEVESSAKFNGTEITIEASENEYRKDIIFSMLVPTLLNCTIETSEDGFVLNDYPVMPGVNLNATLKGLIIIDLDYSETEEKSDSTHDLEGKVTIESLDLTASGAGIEASVSLENFEVEVDLLVDFSDKDLVEIDGSIGLQSFELKAKTASESASVSIEISDFLFDITGLTFDIENFEGSADFISFSTDIAVNVTADSEVEEDGRDVTKPISALIGLDGFNITISDISIDENAESIDISGKLGIGFEKFEVSVNEDESSLLSVVVEPLAISVEADVNISYDEDGPVIEVSKSSVDASTTVSLALNGNGDSISGKAELSFNDDALFSPEMQIDISDAEYGIDITEAYINGYSVKDQIQELVDMMLETVL